MRHLKFAAAFVIIGALLLMPLGSEVHAAGPAPSSLIGASAVYTVNSTTTEVAPVTVSVAPGRSSTRSTPRLSVVTHVVTVKSTVIGLRANDLIVRSAITEGATTQTVDYQVPLASILRWVPQPQTPIGGGVQFTRSWNSSLPDGRPLAHSESGQTDDVWFTHVVTTVKIGQLPPTVLEVTLQQKSGPTTSVAGQALWLIPGLMAPDEGIKVMKASGAAPTQAKPSATTPQDFSCSVTATSHLDTFDNHIVNARVWYSDFQLCGEIASGAFDNFQLTESGAATSPLHNWSVTGYTATPVSATTTSATATAQADFAGTFPLFGVCSPEGTCSSFIKDFQGHAYHTTTLNLTDHQTQLSGEIDANYCNVSLGGLSCQWGVWNTGQFYAGQTFPNDGSIQSATWYIL